MQVVILLIELHNDLLHPRCFTFILHNFSYFHPKQQARRPCRTQSPLEPR